MNKVPIPQIQAVFTVLLMISQWRQKLIALTVEARKVPRHAN
jgi:hypothetical protein